MFMDEPVGEGGFWLLQLNVCTLFMIHIRSDWFLNGAGYTGVPWWFISHSWAWGRGRYM